jgi:hypothetical protein
MPDTGATLQCSRSKKGILSIIVAIVAAGCVMRPTVNLSINTPRQYTVQAWGYPSTDASPGNALYYSLSINLEAAPAFVVVLPDGYQANTKSLDSSLLTQHLAPIEKNDKGDPVSRIHYSDKQKRYWMIFTLNRDGRADYLSLYACGHTMAGILTSPDGQQRFSFPIRQSEILQLFNGPIRVGRDFEILGRNCD